jgi:hypothetical protein
MLGICYIETILKEDNNKGESKMTELEASLITILFLIVFLFLTFLFLRIFDRIRDLEILEKQKEKQVRELQSMTNVLKNYKK